MNVKILIATIMFSCYVTILPMDPTVAHNNQLNTAAFQGNIAKVNELLAQGADPSYKDSVNWTPLLEAASHGHWSIVQTLLDHGADPKSKTSAGLTALHLAAKYGHSAIVLALLQKGAAINASDNFGRTPLHVAARKDHAGTIDVLCMKKGANVNAQDHFGNTPLLNAIEYTTHDSATTVQQLLDLGADVDIKNCDGYTALHEAARRNKLTMLKALFVRYSDPFITDNEGNKAIDVAQNTLIKEMLTEYEDYYRRQNLETLKILLKFSHKNYEQNKVS